MHGHTQVHTNTHTGAHLFYIRDYFSSPYLFSATVCHPFLEDITHRHRKKRKHKRHHHPTPNLSISVPGAASQSHYVMLVSPWKPNVYLTQRLTEGHQTGLCWAVILSVCLSCVPPMDGWAGGPGSGPGRGVCAQRPCLAMQQSTPPSQAIHH